MSKHSHRVFTVYVAPTLIVRDVKFLTTTEESALCRFDVLKGNLWHYIGRTYLSCNAMDQIRGLHL